MAEKRTERQVQPGPAEKNFPSEEFEVTDEHIDEASDESFPASDPPSYSDPVEGF